MSVQNWGSSPAQLMEMHQLKSESGTEIIIVEGVVGGLSLVNAPSIASINLHDIQISREDVIGFQHVITIYTPSQTVTHCLVSIELLKWDMIYNSYNFTLTIDNSNNLVWLKCSFKTILIS